MKYGNTKTEVDGIRFDSKAEARRYTELKMMQECGLIRGLRMQVPFVLIKGAVWSDGKKHRDTIYKADFVYYETENPRKMVVEDVKGFRTDVYKLKKELMKERWGIEIKEVQA